MDRMFIGGDISEDTFSVAGLGAEGNEPFSGSYSMDFEGFGQFLEIITTCCRDRERGVFRALLRFDNGIHQGGWGVFAV
jgi:hypothetical protein